MWKQIGLYLFRAVIEHVIADVEKKKQAQATSAFADLKISGSSGNWQPPK